MYIDHRSHCLWSIHVRTCRVYIRQSNNKVYIDIYIHVSKISSTRIITTQQGRIDGKTNNKSKRQRWKYICIYIYILERERDNNGVTRANKSRETTDCIFFSVVGGQNIKLDDDNDDDEGSIDGEDIIRQEYGVN